MKTFFVLHLLSYPSFWNRRFNTTPSFITYKGIYCNWLTWNKNFFLCWITIFDLRKASQEIAWLSYCSSEVKSYYWTLLISGTQYNFRNDSVELSVEKYMCQNRMNCWLYVCTYIWDDHCFQKWLGNILETAWRQKRKLYRRKNTLL